MQTALLKSNFYIKKNVLNENYLLMLTLISNGFLVTAFHRKTHAYWLQHGGLRSNLYPSVREGNFYGKSTVFI